MKKNLFVFAIILFMLSACGTSTATPAPTLSPASVITATPSPTHAPAATATLQNSAVLPAGLVPANATNEEIARLLFTQWLEHVKMTGSLEDYEVLNISSAPPVYGLDYRLDFVVGVTYSVKPIESEKAKWIAANGIVSENDPWIRGKFFLAGVRLDDEVYTLHIIGTGP